MITKEDIKKLIMQAKLKEAIQATLALPAVQRDQDYGNTATLLLSRYNRNERSHLMGIADDDDLRKERAKITMAVLSILDSLADDESATNDQSLDEVITTSVNPINPGKLTGQSPSTSSTESSSPDENITKILFLASNPSDTAKLQLSKEHSRISSQLQESPQPEKFPIKLRHAVTPSEFAEFLFLERPDIVHFSGHGDRQAPDVKRIIDTKRAGRPDNEDNSQTTRTDESGIFLMDQDKRHSHFVGTTFLKRTFKSIVKRQRIPVRVVVFNACHSSEQAQAISTIVPYVVGTSWSVGDAAAIAFASGFYFGVAQGMDIEGAVDFGINQALAFNEPEDRFLLYKAGKKVEW